MELSRLLGVRPGITALTGGGGKTTAMYILARELSQHSTVVCTTTTPIYPPDHRPVLAGRHDGRLAAALGWSRCVCVGVPTPEGKLAPPEFSPYRLAELARYVLVEADGSRGLPVKAHLSHEPVIPELAGLTVGLVGASGFARPVRQAVHRWECFCQLTGADPVDPVDPENLARLLLAEGLEDLLFINQAESAGAMEQARRLAALLPRPVFAGSLQRGVWECLS